MAMEHRWGKRVDMDVEVILDIRPHGFAHGRVRNASASGLFVETDVRLARHRRVQVIFTLRQGTVAVVQRLSLLVTRCTADGIGLAFHEIRPGTIAALHAAVRVRHGETACRRAHGFGRSGRSEAICDVPDRETACSTFAGQAELPGVQASKSTG